MAGRKPKARYLQVRGWWDFQQYPDRVEAGWTPTWVKSYTALLTDYDYNELSELDRGRLHRIWLLAAKLNNKIPWDERYIRKAINSSPSFRLKVFIDAGMLSEWDENAVTRPPNRRRKPRNQAKAALDELLNESRPEQSRAEKSREEALQGAGLPISVEKRLELAKMLPYLHDADGEVTVSALERAARGCSFGQVCKVRESVQVANKRIGVGYAVNALRDEAKEAA